MLKKITAATVGDLKKGRITDTEIRGFIARRLDSGRVQFGYQYGSRERRRWITLGLLGEIDVAEARRRALKYAGQVSDYLDPADELKMAAAQSENTVNHVLDGYIEAHVCKLRSAKSVTAALANHVRPVIGDTSIYKLKRSDIVKLREKIAKDYPGQADRMLSYLRTAFAWQQERDDDFNPPIVKGAYTGNARERILTSDEIVDLWRALDELEHVPACFPAYVRMLLLTACRCSELRELHTDELECGNQHAMMGGVSTKKATSWTIPGSRTKNGLAHQLPLIPAIKKLLPERKDGFVFSCNDGKDPISRNYQPKRELDYAIAKIRRRDKRLPMKPWVLHDLRRTARSIMAAAGVPEDISERVLNHKKKGMRAVYNRYEYFVEKADALTRLAKHVEDVVAGRAPAAAPGAHLRVVGG